MEKLFPPFIKLNISHNVLLTSLTFSHLVSIIPQVGIFGPQALLKQTKTEKKIWPHYLQIHNRTAEQRDCQKYRTGHFEHFHLAMAIQIARQHNRCKRTHYGND